MTIYLRDIPLGTAQERWREALEGTGLWRLLSAETVRVDEQALNRVLAAPVWARLSAPHYHAAAMDGFALRARDTDGASPSGPVTLGSDQFGYVDTGDPLPDWANAVVPIELVEPLDLQGGPAEDLRGPAAIRIRAALPPWKHVRPMGEDMVATELVLPSGHLLRPVDLGAAAGCGHETILVARKPRVAIIPTGTELKPIGEPVGPGDIIEYNSVVLAAQVESWGGHPLRQPIVSDDFDAIRHAVRVAARDADLVLLIAGSSAGSEDFSARVVESLGSLLVHGVAVRPGHPVILGMLGAAGQSAALEPAPAGGEQPAGPRPVPIIGVPGYPVSAALTGEIFIEPLLARWTGRQPRTPASMTATLTRKIVSPAGDDDYVRVAVGRVGDRMLAAPLSRGAGVISSLVRADGIVILPRGSQGAPAGEKVSVRLYRPLAEIERTILAIGSHDLTLDLLAQHLVPHGRRLVSANTGSLGGLLALRRGEAHIAGAHLLDPDSGEYNLAYIQRYLPELPVVVITLVGREQGLMVPAGNPHGLRSLADLHGSQIRYVNRQRGAGTRILLDYHLEKLGLQASEIRGYSQEEYTHLAVAAAIASGRADCGLGIPAAAQALGLDFVPLYQERYDLIIPKGHYNSELVLPLSRVLHEQAFRDAVSAMPGYDVSRMGDVVAGEER